MFPAAPRASCDFSSFTMQVLTVVTLLAPEVCEAIKMAKHPKHYLKAQRPKVSLTPNVLTIPQGALLLRVCASAHARAAESYSAVQH